MRKQAQVSRRALLRFASRAAVGVMGIGLVGCGGTPTYNERDSGVEPDETIDQVASEDAKLIQEEPVVPPPSRTGSTRRIAGTIIERLPLSPADSEWAVVIPHERIDLDEWRRKYHWSRLQVAPKREIGPRLGGRMVLHGQSPRLWSPIADSRERVTSGGAPSILQLLYSQLIVLVTGDEADPHRTAVAGDLARSWEIPDEQSLIFQIRDDVHWPSDEPDSGRLLTPFAIRYMHEMYRDERVAQYGVYRTVDRIEADDDAEIISFSLSEPTSFLPIKMATPDHVIMPLGWTPDTAGVWDAPELPPAGTGPFRLRSWTGPAGTWTLDRNDEYFKHDLQTGARLPFVDRIRGGNHSWQNDLAEVYEQREPVWKDWRDGWFDGISLERPGELLDAFEYFPDVMAELAPPVPGRGSRLVFAENVANSIADVRVRIALSSALDRVELAADFHDGLAVPDCGLNWTGVGSNEADAMARDWPWSLEELGENYQYDPERSRALLQMAGYTAERPLQIGIDSGTVEGVNRTGPISVTNLGIIRRQWSKALGDLVEARIIHRAPRGSDPLGGYPPHADANILAGQPSQAFPADPDPSTYWVPEWNRASPDFDMYATGDNMELASLWDAQRHTLDFSERSEILEQIRQRRTELMPEINLVNPCGLFVRRANVFDLGISYFAHDPLDAPKQLERTWKIEEEEG